MLSAREVRLIHKVMVLATVPMAVLVSVTGWTLTAAIEDQLRVELEAETRAQLTLRTVMLKQDVRHRFESLARIASDPIYAEGTEAQRLGALRAHHHAVKERFEGLYLDDLDGNVVGVDGTHFNVRDRPYFRRIQRGERVVSRALESRATGDRIVVLTVPLRTEGDELIGALAGTVLVDDLVESASLLPPRFDGFAALLEKDGTLMSGERIPDGVAANVFATHEDRSTVDIDGARYLLFAEPGPQIPWRLVIGYPEAEALAFPRKLRRATAFTILVAVLLTALVAAFVARRITRPVVALRAGHDRVARGDLEVHVEVSTSDEIADIARSFNAMVARIREETESRASAEVKLERAQRLETVGLLAGGVAHDFNNLLMTILANAEFAAEDSDDPDVEASLGEIITASKRGADLTRQLLGFARRQPHLPADVDLGEVVRSMEPLLKRVLPETIRLTTEVASQCGAHVDVGQIQQVLLNLVINARDAIDAQGHVRVTVDADRESARIVVQDDGSGIGAEALPHIFDPFFTTKDATGGTGLGLSMVHGIVEQHGGAIDVESEPGNTAFTLRFARVRLTSATPRSVRAPDLSALVGSLPAGRVLVVEDDPSVQRATVQGLKRMGLDVAVAADGQSALERFERAPHAFIAIVTDVVMPRMSGPELVERVRQQRDDIPVVFVTGYQDRSVEAELSLPRSTLIMKPATTEQIARAVEALIHGATHPPKAADASAPPSS